MFAMRERHTRSTSPLWGGRPLRCCEAVGWGYPLVAHLKVFALGTPHPNPPHKGEGHTEFVGRLVNDLPNPPHNGEGTHRVSGTFPHETRHLVIVKYRTRRTARGDRC